MGRRFSNPNPAHRHNGFGAVLRWGVFDRLAGRRTVHPPGPSAQRIEPDLARVRAAKGGPRLTWIGHSSFLVSLVESSVLIDPVFSKAGWIYRRHVQPGLLPHQMPPLSALLVTHSHYDHLDLGSVRELPRDLPVIVPLRLGRWFRRRGFHDVREIDWWQSCSEGALRVTLVPARHWSRRRIGDTNTTLWGGFVIEERGLRLYHCGDSAWFEGFSEIGKRFPGLSAALLPIGAYSPAWFMESHHLNPEQAGRAFLELGAGCLVPMHWGTFHLADEPLAEPAERLRAWWREHGPRDGRELRVLRVGETLDLPRAD